MPAGVQGASGLAAAAALYSAVQASVAENKTNEDAEDDEEGKAAKEGIKTGKEVCRVSGLDRAVGSSHAFGRGQPVTDALTQGEADGKEGTKMEDGGLAGALSDKGKDEAVAKVVEALSSVIPTGPGVPPPPSPPKEG